MTWQKKFIEWRNYFLMGRGEVAIFGTLGTYFALGSVWLQTFFPNNTLAQAAMAGTIGIVFIVGSFLIGVAYDKWKIFHEMNEFGNRRNPFVDRMDSMQKELTEIKEMLKNGNT